MSKPIPLSTTDQTHPGDIWVHANGSTRGVERTAGKRVYFETPLGPRDCSIREWQEWRAQSRLVSRYGVRRP